MKDLSKEQKINNIFIEDLKRKNSNILIIKVNNLYYKEQEFLNLLNFEKMFHNLQFFSDPKLIKEYIEKFIKKSLLNFTKNFIFIKWMKIKKKR